MEYIPTFAANKRDPERIKYADPRLKAILEDTYGITCYQEQYMLIARKLANFTPGQADELRKGIAKKLRHVLDKVKPMFLEGCANNGVARTSRRACGRTPRRPATTPSTSRTRRATG